MRNFKGQEIQKDDCRDIWKMQRGFILSLKKNIMIIARELLFMVRSGFSETEDG